MRNKFRMALPLAAALLLACSCAPKTPENGENPGGDTPEPEKPVVTEYIGKLSSPDYAAISAENEEKYTVYYFDGAAGNDFAAGTSATEAKKSLSVANEIAKTATAENPVKILLKAGTKFTGTLTLEEFEATEETPLIVGAYGADETAGNAKERSYPTIEPKADGTGVEIKAGNVRVSGLEITGQKAKRGVNMTTTKAGAMKNIVVADCYIHDINYVWDTAALGLDETATPETLTTTLTGAQVQQICPDSRYDYGNGGIFCSSPTDEFQGASWLENVWIENNTIERVARSGMFLDSTWSRRPGHDFGKGKYYKDEVTGEEYGYYPLRNFVIRDNDLSYVGGDSIVLLSARDSYIERNTSYHASYLGRGGYYNAGIWPHSCENLVMQYNEAAYTHLDNGCGDGQGFDIDIGNSDILFQYNYSHHNAGGGILLCSVSSNELQYDKNGNFVLDEDGLPIRKEVSAHWENNQLRNNVFADNKGPAVRFQATIGSLDFDNNVVIYPGNVKNQKMFLSAINGYLAEARNWNFRNNIFYARDNEDTVIDVALCETETCVFDGNVFYGFNDKFNESVKNATAYISKNAYFIDPGFAGVEAKDGLAAAAAFAANAEVLKLGKLLPVMNAYDYSGNDIAKTGYMGAFCKANKS